ncbi:MAG: 3-oxoadipyl-CoA thiolase [Proteobacteria bacterium]|nr:3-oxoadipyl-CoA thiolase [Pseudomonadota bacterium]
MLDAYICDALRTPVGRYAGALSSVRTDDLAALPIKALIERNQGVDWAQLDDVILGCANQAGEDNRNVARMAALLAGLPVTASATTLNRLCGSSLDAVGQAARAIKAGDTDLMIAGGVESMSRAPFVMAKAESAFSRAARVFDTTIGWRFINPLMSEIYGVDSMPETADNVAEQYSVSREEQDSFAYGSQQRWKQASDAGYFEDEIIPVEVKQRKGEPLMFTADEHPRPSTSLEALAKLRPINGPGKTVTAGNASGVNDGACALILASENGLKSHGLQARARVIGMTAYGVEPRIMGMGPAPAVKKLLKKAGLTISDMDVIELNEAFAAQAIAVLRELDLPADAPHVNAWGGAIAMGHPLGMSGARLVTTAMYQLQRNKGRYALCTMCVGVGQGIALMIEKV